MIRGLFLAALLGAGPAWGVRPLTPAAPEFPDGLVWLNAKPLSLALMRKKKAVVVAFFNVGNINSLRALPVLGQWFDRYSLDGLMVIGVHVPEYEYQRNPLALSKTIQKLSLQFPVVLDTEGELAKAYDNKGWPAFFLIDHKGKIIHDQLGESGYAEFEGEIRDAIDRIGGCHAPRDAPLVEDPPQTGCGTTTANVSAGSDRGHPVRFQDLLKRRASLILRKREEELAYQGEWTPGPETLTMSKKNKGRLYQVGVVYRGARAFALFGPGRRPQRVYVLQDEQWVKPENAGRDIQFDDEDESYVTVDATRVYDLVRNQDDAPHEVIVVPQEAGFTLYEFSFSDRCMADWL